MLDDHFGVYPHPPSSTLIYPHHYPHAEATHDHDKFQLYNVFRELGLKLIMLLLSCHFLNIGHKINFKEMLSKQSTIASKNADKEGNSSN